ncbi:MAG TPA: hypothetical protein DEH78_28025, partial [Solibacterales bacterium]|nr:hypothetical protein [Bryobacterales bacterium]
DTDGDFAAIQGEEFHHGLFFVLCRCRAGIVPISVAGFRYNRRFMTIRQASAGDCHTIAQFNTAMALETEHVHLPPERILAGVEAVVRDRTKGVYYVAEVSGEVVGQLMLTYEWSDW